MKQTIIAILISLVLSVACCAQDAGLLVYFEGSKLGDTYFAKRIAFVDDGQSRLPSRHTENIRQIADTVAPEVMIIAGHGPAANAEEMKEHVAMFDYTTALVADGIKSGRTDEELLADPSLLKWSAWDIKGMLVSYEV